VWCVNQHFDASKPSILLNSHHDTVKPNVGYTRDPFKASLEDGMLYGLGSNDAGGALVGLVSCFLHYYKSTDLAYNLVFCASSEEEISGTEGIALAQNYFPEIAFGIIGEPTATQLAIAEKGLIVIDGVAHGRAGHAAREEGENAIYKAMQDIARLQNFSFEKESTLLGPIKLSVTQIEAGYQHNVVPDRCSFVIDVRTTDAYTNQEVFDRLQQELQSDLSARSLRLSPSFIAKDHPIVQAGIGLGKQIYGSPTLSDQSLLCIPSLKCGPGESARSHTADEFIRIDEIQAGIETYIGLLQPVLTTN
jgi:acetylornithine deacetylase